MNPGRLKTDGEKTFQKRLCQRFAKPGLLSKTNSVDLCMWLAQLLPLKANPSAPVLLPGWMRSAAGAASNMLTLTDGMARALGRHT